MKNFDVKDFDINKNYVIEASAGTGKTYNIIEIVKKMVNVHNIDLNKILIVTYTEKATGELKDRIRKEVKGVNVDNAPIFTIHSFCKNTIDELGLSSNLPLSIDMADDSFLSKFLDKYFLDGPIKEDLLNSIKAYEVTSLDTLKSKFIKAIDSYYLDSNNQEDSRIITFDANSELNDYLALRIACKNSNTIEDLFNKCPDFKRNYQAFVEKKDKDQNIEGFLEEINKVYKDKFDFKGFSKRSTWIKNNDLTEEFTYFYNLKDNKDYPLESILVSKYLKDAYISFQEEKVRYKVQTFNDMLRNVKEAIKNEPSLLQALKEKYKYAIIDEFQDTNQLQFDIFSSIFLDDLHHLIVVGDPKQSIYSFQGADVNVYNKATKLIEEQGGIKASLTKNYRSTENMVSSCNKLFSYYNFDNFEGSEFLIEGKDKKAHGAKYLGKDIPAFYIAKSKKLESGEIDAKSNEFSLIACQQIIDFCTMENGKTRLQVKDGGKGYRNVSFKDFAILIKASSETNQIQNTLTKLGIPFIRNKDNRVFKGNVCYHWIQLLKAIDSTDFTGKNRNAFKKVLFTKFFGYNLTEISDDKFNKDDVEEIRLINSWKEFAFDHKWEDLVDSIIYDSKLHDNLSTLDSIQTLAMYKQIGNYIINYLSNNHSITELIDNLVSLNNGSGEIEDDDAAIVEKSTDFDCVKIITYHSSKGLQYPVTINLGGFKQLNNRDGVNIYSLIENNEKKKYLTFAKLKDKSIEKKSKEEETIAELKRLFYVGFTRAQFVSIIPYYDSYVNPFLKESLNSFMKDYPNDYKEINRSNESIDSLKKSVSKILEQNNKVSVGSSEEQTSAIEKLTKSLYSKKTFKHSYSSLSHPSSEEDEDDEFNKEGDLVLGLSAFDTFGKGVEGEYDQSIAPLAFTDHYPKGARLGTALHSIFEKLNYREYERNLSFNINNAFIEQGIILLDEWMDVTKKMVNNVMNAQFVKIIGSNRYEETFKLKDLEQSQIKTECEFNYNFKDQKLKNYCNGFIDLMINRNEVYSIIDWKSDSLSEDFLSYSNFNSLKGQVDSHYSIQRTLYAYCLINWLKIKYQNLSYEEIFNKHFGGVYYVFLRGCNENTSNGIYSHTWNNYTELEESYNYILKTVVKGGTKND